jgi:ATP phosphoribosyltransferase regulatory subunit
VQQYALAEVRRRRAVESAITSALRGWSYEEVLLPVLDYEEVFERGAGHGAAARMYRLIDPEGQVLGVRPDLTPLVAKLVATGLRDEPLPIRLYYAGDVVRPEGPKALGRGEFQQVGFEQVGGDRAAADLEVAVVALEALAAAGLPEVRLTLSHSAIPAALATACGLEAAAAARLRELIDRRDGTGLDEALAAARVSAPLRRAHRALLAARGGARLASCRLGRVRGAPVQQALRELRRLKGDLEKLGYSKAVEIDLAEVGGFEYYTGVRFRLYAEGVGFAVGGGGRYDRLLGQFGVQRPAVGFSFSLDRVLQALEASGGGPEARPEPSRAVGVRELGRLGALRAALGLRRQGERVRLC